MLFTVPAGPVGFQAQVENKGTLILSNINLSSDNFTLACPQGAGAATMNPGQIVTCNGSYLVTLYDLEKGSLGFIAQATASTVRATSQTKVSAPAALTMTATPQLGLDVDAGSCTVSNSSAGEFDCVGGPQCYSVCAVECRSLNVYSLKSNCQSLANNR